MSAIAIQSSGSGAGTLTIAAPITATNRTLTLPDETGTFVTSGSSTYLTSKIQPITASVASSAMTVTLNPTVLDFRATPLTSGTVNTRTVSAAISVVVPSGATLGSVNSSLILPVGPTSRVIVLALDNAGTIELAVVNLAGGTNLDETTLISTTAISAAATSSSVIYSTTARTSLPFRVVGYVESTQATAGTWATAPSTIQGYGGQALAAMSSLGYGQTWQNVAASRAFSTTYYNVTGKPIVLAISGQGTVNASSTTLTLTINGVVTMAHGTVLGAGGATLGAAIDAVIPPGASYSLAQSQCSIVHWFELR